MREIDKIIMAAREANASDIHITKGLYLLYRVKGTLVHGTHAAYARGDRRDAVRPSG